MLELIPQKQPTLKPRGRPLPSVAEHGLARPLLEQLRCLQQHPIFSPRARNRHQPCLRQRDTNPELPSPSVECLEPVEAVLVKSLLAPLGDPACNRTLSQSKKDWDQLPVDSAESC